ATATETSRNRVGAMVRKAQSIDQRAGLGQPKQTRSGLPRLRSGRHGAYFNKAESELAEPVHSLCVLVETRRETKPVWKPQAHEIYRRTAQWTTGETPVETRRVERKFVSALGIECEESRPKCCIGHGG